LDGGRGLVELFSEHWINFFIIYHSEITEVTVTENKEAFKYVILYSYCCRRRTIGMVLYENQSQSGNRDYLNKIQWYLKYLKVTVCLP
jgi:DNA-directed RNA polymerase subunit N (RpoN/RPB10)